MKRECGACSLCCKLMPMTRNSDDQVRGTIKAMIDTGMASPRDFVGMRKDFNKPAGERCPHQRHHKGCSIYAERPFGCRFWNCRWLGGDDTDGLSRPDRAHYVIDIMPDFITANDDTTGLNEQVPVVQVWIDPDYPDAHRDPALRAFLQRRGETEGMAALIRYSSNDAFVLFPPALSGDGQWHETERKPSLEREHTGDEIDRVLGGIKVAAS